MHFDQFVRGKLEDWKSRVTGYKALADTGIYPGSKTISAIQKIAERLLAEKESYGLVEEYLNRKDELADTA